MLIGIVGKTNSGKTTYFCAATMVDAEISNRIFTTIKPNSGVSYVAVKCACKKLDLTCNPKNCKCINGTRYIPIKLVDVAGLVPGAHKGRGLGNQFLSDIMEANALIHVIDISGGTDSEGNPVQPGTHNPVDDIEFLKKEINYWILCILKKKWETLMRKMQSEKGKLEDYLFKQLSGLGISVEDINHALKKSPIEPSSGDDDLLEFISVLREEAKPIIISGNKVDITEGAENFHKLSETELNIIPCSAESELALRRADENKIIEYSPGDNKFQVKKQLDEQQQRALDFIKKKVLEKFGSTGVQKVINTAVFDLLDMIAVYPVANISKKTDKKGNVLPETILVKKGTTLKEFAYKIHSEIGEKFIGGLDVERKKIGADYILQDNDIVEILISK